ncbi:MAG: hypothetical protein AABZ06_08440 [Bdellovibrionota bacterium]
MKKIALMMIAAFVFSLVAFAEEGTTPPPSTDQAAPAPVEQQADQTEPAKTTKKAKKAKAKKAKAKKAKAEKKTEEAPPAAETHEGGEHH